MYFGIFGKTRIRSEELHGNKIIKRGKMGSGSASIRKVESHKKGNSKQHM